LKGKGKSKGLLNTHHRVVKGHYFDASRWLVFWRKSMLVLFMLVISNLWTDRLLHDSQSPGFRLAATSATIAKTGRRLKVRAGLRRMLAHKLTTTHCASPENRH
jgi:hypothetical protein